MMTREVVRAHFEDLMSYNPSTFDNVVIVPLKMFLMEAAALPIKFLQKKDFLSVILVKGVNRIPVVQLIPHIQPFMIVLDFVFLRKAEWEFSVRAGQEAAFHTGNGGSNLAGSDASALSEVVLIDGTNLGAGMVFEEGFRFEQHKLLSTQRNRSITSKCFGFV